MAPSASSLRCPGCAAPLQWRGQASVIECKYCQTHVVVGTGERTQAPAQRIVSRTAAPQTTMVVVGVAGALLVGAIAFSVTMTKRVASSVATGGVATSDSEEPRPLSQLASVALDSSPEAVSSQMKAKAWNGNITVPAPAPLKTVMYRWEEEKPERIVLISLQYRERVPDEVHAALEAQMGRTFAPDEDGRRSYNSDGISMWSDEASIYINNHDPEKPGCEARAEALWTVVRAAALGSGEPLPLAKRQDVLGRDYPLERVIDLDLGVVVDGAAAEVARVFPGAEGEGDRFTIGLDHPLFYQVAFNWENAAGGRLGHVHLAFHRNFAESPPLTAVAECLKTEFAKPPTEHVTDHLAGKKTLHFMDKDGGRRLNLLEQGVHLSFDRRRAPSEESIDAIFSALARCRVAEIAP